ncbi:MAG: FtsQ-type POTRA domain-containing protein [Deltaproteobacteria bacterium]|nr:FtsQ-type POTRA domain-containing protein [Deltaproteobacteria bacterium]
MWTTVLCASVMLIGAVTSYIAWHFMRQSALFELQAIESEGHKRTSHEEIVRYMSPNYAAAGASAGENIFTIDIDMLRASILRHPWVKDAEVQRIVPGTLAVRIVEHEARAVVALGALYYVDEDGEPFSRASVQEIGDLPVLSGLDAALYEEDRVTWARFIKLGVAFAEAAKKGTLAVGEIQLDPALGVVAHLLPSGTTASFGTGDFAAKVQRLKDVRALLAQRGQSADSYLLDNPRRPDAVVARLSGQKAQKSPLIVSAR